MRRTIWLGWTVLAAGAVYGQTTAAAMGGITGIVQTESGKGVNNAAVAIRVRPGAPGAKVTFFNTDVLTGSDGSFTVTKVPDGIYAVCPDARAASLLSPCDWETEPTVTVANGKSTAMKPITLKTGADLWVHVDDPQGKRASTEGKVPGATLLLMVRVPGGRLMPIPLTTSNANGFEHHMLVPTGRDMVVMAVSQTYSITNASLGLSAPAGSQQGVSATVNIPAGTAQFKQTIAVH